MMQASGKMLDVRGAYAFSPADKAAGYKLLDRFVRFLPFTLKTIQLSRPHFSNDSLDSPAAQLALPIVKNVITSPTPHSTPFTNFTLYRYPPLNKSSDFSTSRVFLLTQNVAVELYWP